MSSETFQIDFASAHVLWWLKSPLNDLTKYYCHDQKGKKNSLKYSKMNLAMPIEFRLKKRPWPKIWPMLGKHNSQCTFWGIINPSTAEITTCYYHLNTLEYNNSYIVCPTRHFMINTSMAGCVAASWITCFSPRDQRAAFRGRILQSSLLNICLSQPGSFQSWDRAQEWPYTLSWPCNYAPRRIKKGCFLLYSNPIGSGNWSSLGKTSKLRRVLLLQNLFQAVM